MVDSIGQLNSVPVTNNKVATLSARLKEVSDKQGLLGNIWNDIKEATNTGVSETDCKHMLIKYQMGEISFDEALEYINSFEKKQDTMVDLGANIITGIVSIAFATASVSAGPIGWALALAKGAPIGAAVKTAVKFIDRVTNKKHNDEFDFKQMTKDALSGAVTGTTSAVASGVGIGIKAGNFGLAVANGAKCGAQCGALAGSSSYLINTALDKDKYFNLQDFVVNTATSAFVSGTVGGAVGVGMYGLSSNVGKDVSKSVSRTIIDDSTTSSTRKILGSGEKDLLAFS